MLNARHTIRDWGRSKTVEYNGDFRTIDALLIEDTISEDGIDVGVLGQATVAISIPDLWFRDRRAHSDNPLFPTMFRCIEKQMRKLYTLLGGNKRVSC